MKIAIFTDTFYPMMNGVVTATISLIKALADKGHEIVVIAPDNKGIEKFKYKNIEVFPLKGVSAFFYPEFKITFMPDVLKKKIAQFNPDIIHYQTPFIIGYYAIRLAKKLNKKLVYTFHTYINDEGYIKASGVESKYLINFLVKSMDRYNRFFIESADAVMCPSTNVADYIEYLGISSENVSIIPNPLPFKNISRKHNYLSKYNSDDIILFVGRLSREKNLEFGLNVISKVSKLRKNIKFVIVGKGPIEYELNTLVVSMGIEKSVVFIGGVEHDKLINSDIFQKAKLFFTPSKTETFGMTLLESMYFGVPVVGVDERGVGELIENGFNGYKSEEDTDKVAENIIRILEDEKLRKTLGENGKKLTENYKLDNIVCRLEKLYSNLSGQK